MAKRATKLRVIAWTILQETFRRKVFYLVLILLGLILLSIMSSRETVDMATDAGEGKLVTQIHTDLVTGTFEIWTGVSVFLSLYLGAVGVPGEIAAKTLVNVLSRPVERWVYLTGRWVGTLAFVWVFQLVGLAFAMGAARFYAIPYGPLLWLGCVNVLVTAVLYSGVSLALSTFLPPALAGAFGFLLPMLPDLVSDGMKHPKWILRTLSNVAYFLAPARMPIDLVGQSFKKELIHTPWALYGQVLAENTLYAIMFVVVAAAIFSRREIRLR